MKMKYLLILLIAFMVFSCSNEVSGVEQEPVFEVSMICSDLLTKGIQKEQYKNLSRYRKDSIAKFDSIIDDLVANDPKPKKAKRECSETGDS